MGFVADVRRLNVAVTRARRHLCLVTDSSTTSRASNGLLEHMEQFGDVRSAHQYFPEIDAVRLPDVAAARITHPHKQHKQLNKSIVHLTTELDSIQN